MQICPLWILLYSCRWVNSGVYFRFDKTSFSWVLHQRHIKDPCISAIARLGLVVTSVLKQLHNRVSIVVLCVGFKHQFQNITTLLLFSRTYSAIQTSMIPSVTLNKKLILSNLYFILNITGYVVCFCSANEKTSIYQTNPHQNQAMQATQSFVSEWISLFWTNHLIHWLTHS